MLNSIQDFDSLDISVVHWEFQYGFLSHNDVSLWYVVLVFWFFSLSYFSGILDFMQKNSHQHTEVLIHFMGIIAENQTIGTIQMKQDIFGG